MDRSLFYVVGILAVGSALLHAGGCAVLRARTEPAAIARTEPRTLIGQPPRPGETILGRSVEGRPIYGHLLGSGEDRVLIIATIHGNEAAGTPLIYRLVDHLAARPALLRGRRVILLPNVNPDGYERRSRYNANRVDLNRNFPADNRRNTKRFGMSALSEPESRVIYDAIERFQPALIITIHQPVACVDYDGPAADVAMAMAAASDLKIKRLGARPGSLGSYAGNMLGIPTITLELPRSAGRLDENELWDRYGSMLLAGIQSATRAAK